MRSYLIYIDSILSPYSFVAKKCPSLKDYDAGRCDKSPSVYVGHLTNTSTK